MAVTRSYSCNLCRSTARDIDDLVGLHYEAWPKGWSEVSALTAENHICMSCLSSLQALPPRCGQGFECRGGPKCGSDHK